MTYQKVRILETKPYQIVFELEDGQVVTMPKIYFWERVKKGLYEVTNQSDVDSYETISSRVIVFEGNPVNDAAALIASEGEDTTTNLEQQEDSVEQINEYSFIDDPKPATEKATEKEDHELFKSIQSKVIDRVLDKKKIR